ncbi:hypothetical protein GPECTOR_49g522 [Gonium pectorale]|uniref:Ankyrin repeat domain-containing protein n=1 Tax=Gonium pectorale TaxID=33097 RepID=A0A150G7Z0_GONPE|nr:hypothetical protein GPECTOR_49g522 [Gonium pectorale]|eukprot:KXZ45938.1 hypothetical protein GPECTOR_49g522 [Gonium pectorale]
MYDWFTSPEGLARDGGGAAEAFREWEWGEILDAAAASSTADWRAKVEWLESRGHGPAQASCSGVLRRPDAVERLRWLRQRGYRPSSTVVDVVASCGNMAALEYLLSEGADARGASTTMTAMAGQLDCLRVLWAAGADLAWDVGSAAAGGHLHVVAWLVEEAGQAAQLDGGSVFAEAARSGSVELMSWLRQRGVAMDATVFLAAVESGCEETMAWLVEQGCPLPASDAAFMAAFRLVDLVDVASLRCLPRVGCPWPAGFLTLALRSRGPSVRDLRALLAAGCPVTRGDVVEAAAYVQESYWEERSDMLALLTELDPTMRE